MAFPEQVSDAWVRLAAAHRTLQIARQVQERQLDGVRVIDDVIESLVDQVAAVEKELVGLLDGAGGVVQSDGWALAMGVSDRRARMRPKFVLHKLAARAPVGRRNALPAPVAVS